MMLVEVILWGELVGVLAWDENTQTTSFEFAPKFIQSGLELSPILLPVSTKVLEITNTTLASDISIISADGLPLFIADSLPDKFGTDLLLKYLEKEGKNYRDLSPLEKLTYIGNRGMGALEYKPSKAGKESQQTLNLNTLSQLSESLLNNQPIANRADLANLIHVGTSPGGAQPKVLLNMNRDTGDLYRGDQLPLENQESWILKFNKDIGVDSDKEWGKIEYAYYLIARKCGITIMDSELLSYENEHYFMTKRFDRLNGEKIHTQTVHALAGMNYKLPNTYSYEQLFTVLNRMKVDYPAKEQLFRIMVFNIIGRNVDDHTKNFGFSMDKSGNWQFSPAYDLTFTYNENYKRPTPHFLSVNGVNSNHQLEDVLSLAEKFTIKQPKSIISLIQNCFLDWENTANTLAISQNTLNYIASKHLTLL